MRIKLILLLILVLSVLPLAGAVSPSDYDMNAPENLVADHLYCEAALLIDLDSGEVLFSENSNVRMYPASTTKIMTLLVGLEEGPGLDEVVTIPKEAANIEENSSVIPVKVGDQMTYRDLLYSFMMTSGNDGANAVAVLTSGSISAFVERMNARAAQLGCDGTHFVNAHGLHDDNHYTTATDLAKIACEGLKNDVYADIVATDEYTMRILRNGSKVVQTVKTRNNLLLKDDKYYYQYCTGVKTGHTNKAGYCFVGSAERDGMHLLSVALNCPEDKNKWYDTARLFEYGFTRYTDCTLQTLYERSGIGTLTFGSQDLPLTLSDSTSLQQTVKVVANSETSMNAAVNRFVGRASVEAVEGLSLPITAGQTVATLRYTSDDGTEITVNLLAAADLKKAEMPKQEEYSGESEKSGVWPIIRILLIILIVLILAFLGLLLYANWYYSKRRRKKRHKRKAPR